MIHNDVFALARVDNVKFLGFALQKRVRELPSR